MKKEAEEHAKEDAEKKARAEARNKLDNIVFTAEKLIRESGDKIKEEEKKQLEEAIAKAKEKLANEATTKQEFEEQSQQLSNLLARIGSQFYQGGAASAQTESTQPGQQKKGEEKPDNSEKPEEGEIVD